MKRFLSFHAYPRNEGKLRLWSLKPLLLNFRFNNKFEHRSKKMPSLQLGIEFANRKCG